jgi:mersacidin/lichenicidin family type 2 lantibiotic
MRRSNDSLRPFYSGFRIRKSAATTHVPLTTVINIAKEVAMTEMEIIRAWKDKEYRLNLSEFEREGVPENPAGLIELSDLDLIVPSGGTVSVEFCPSFAIVFCSFITVCPSINHCPEQS